jgi:hypothetical protein
MSVVYLHTFFHLKGNKLFKTSFDDQLLNFFLVHRYGKIGLAEL